VVDKPKEEHPTAVPMGAMRQGETQPYLDWVEPSVWTPRMLQALQQGPKGGRWYSLMDKVIKPDNLRAAFARVKRNDGSPGVDHVTIEHFESRLTDNQNARRAAP
jgi:RNA-directed DNA polymerase